MSWDNTQPVQEGRSYALQEYDGVGDEHRRGWDQQRVVESHEVRHVEIDWLRLYQPAELFVRSQHLFVCKICTYINYFSILFMNSTVQLTSPIPASLALTANVLTTKKIKNYIILSVV